MLGKISARRALFVGAGLALTAFHATPAQAALLLSYNGGAPITDNGAGDSDPSVGSIINSTIVGSFGVAITVAASNSPGTATAGLIQVQSLDVKSIGTGTATLNILVSDTGFTAPGIAGSTMRLSSDYGTTLTLGNAGDSTTFRSFADPSNAQPAVAVATAPLVATRTNVGLVTESFSGANTATFVRGLTAYSLANTIAITLSPGGQANISGTTVTQVVPEPTTLAALAGLALVAARRR